MVQHLSHEDLCFDGERCRWAQWVIDAIHLTETPLICQGGWDLCRDLIYSQVRALPDFLLCGKVDSGDKVECILCIGSHETPRTLSLSEFEDRTSSCWFWLRSQSPPCTRNRRTLYLEISRLDQLLNHQCDSSTDSSISSMYTFLWIVRHLRETYLHPF